MKPISKDAKQKETPSEQVVHFLSFSGTAEELLAALVEGQPQARRALYEEYSGHVQRVLVRIMGVDDSIPDLLSETFVQAFSSIHTVKNAGSLKAWLSRVAVFVARGRIRQRRRRRMFQVLTSTGHVDTRSEQMDTDGREALHVLYALLDELPTDERIVFALRFIDGKGFVEIGEICCVSRATLNRRLNRAQARFLEMAKEEPLLHEWIERGTRWQV